MLSRRTFLPNIRDDKISPRARVQGTALVVVSPDRVTHAVTDVRFDAFTCHSLKLLIPNKCDRPPMTGNLLLTQWNRLAMCQAGIGQLQAKTPVTTTCIPHSQIAAN